MNGQLSIFDIRPAEQAKRPCDYSFKRYIGQKVCASFDNKVHTIAEIEPYYTITSDGMVGTPSTIWPAEEQ